MPVDIRGSKTEINLLTAFAGESQARNRYSFFAGQARKDGYVQIGAVFDRTAEQERAHAKRLFKFLQGGAVEIRAVFPAGIIGSTAENLEAAAKGEEYEYKEMYPAFAETAKEEGFAEIAAVFAAIARAELQHARQYRAFLENIKRGRVFGRDEPVTWYCSKCGYVHEGTAPPEICPACAHPRAYYELLVEPW